MINQLEEEGIDKTEIIKIEKIIKVEITKIIEVEMINQEIKNIEF